MKIIAHQLTDEEMKVLGALQSGKELILSQREEKEEEFRTTESLRMAPGGFFSHWRMDRGSRPVWTFPALELIRTVLKTGEPMFEHFSSTEESCSAKAEVIGKEVLASYNRQGFIAV